MTAITIARIPIDEHHSLYEAAAGTRTARGKTAGEALDALSAQLPEDEAGTLIIVQRFQPDRFFSAEQQARLGTLMAAWRAARDAGQDLPAAEGAELEGLIEAEFDASAERMARVSKGSE